MAISQEHLHEILVKSFPNAKIKIQDLVGDQDHYQLEITDKSFAGISLIKQHKIVKEALREVLKTDLHAITIKTRPPE
jgi:stress-induced morphogen